MTSDVILPGATIGVLGGGQLGRMFAIAAQQMGYHVAVFTPEKDSPASEVCGLTVCAPFEDEPALEEFGRKVQVATIEFENIPVAALNFLSKYTRVRPNPDVLHITQHRLREKNYLKQLSLPVVPYHHVKNMDDLSQGLEAIGTPAILKTAGFGYDGKGQSMIGSREEARTVYGAYQDQEMILEQFIEFDKEISVIGARDPAGNFIAFGPIENRHRKHILDLSLIPAYVPQALAAEAIEMTRSVMTALDVVGLLCIEFFVTGQGKLLINEMAPRPHNSGHYSLDVCCTSQFEQQVRAVTGLPLGDTTPRSAAVMLNLLGDLWNFGTPNWESGLAHNDTHLHLYGKKEARPGRKMGHLTVCAQTREQALHMALSARQCLSTMKSD